MTEEATPEATPARDLKPCPWTQIWIDAAPIPPVWVGCLFAVGHVLLGMLFHTVFVLPSSDAVWSTPEAQGVQIGTIVFALIIGYATAALAYARRGHETTLRDLREATDCSDTQFALLRRQILSFNISALRSVGLIAALVSMVGTYYTTNVAAQMSNAGLVWILWQNALFAWLLTRTFSHDLIVSRRISRLMEEHAEIELFDLTPLAPLARRGLQSALLIILGISIFSLLLGTGDPSPLVPITQTGTVLLAAFAVVLPSFGVRRRVHDAKQEELARLSSEIRSLSLQPHPTEAPTRNHEREARLATLLQLSQHVGAVREWPFDLGTLGRFLLYAVIGVGSWVGGAAVERLLDSLLG